MARRMNAGTIAVVVVGGIAAIVAVDHFVLKGKLGIAGRINQIIGQIKQSLGQGAGPITPSTPPPGGLGPSVAQETPEQLAAELEYESEMDMEPETAALARMRARRSAYYGRKRRVRLGGYGV